MTGSELVSSVALHAELEQLLDGEVARRRGVDEDRLVRLGAGAIARPMRRFCSASCSSRLRKESSWPASSGSTAPPCVRRSRPSCARIARSRRAVIDGDAERALDRRDRHASALGEHRQDQAPALLRNDRRRACGRTLLEHRRPNLSEAGARFRALRALATGSYVCATSRSHMFESSALGPETNGVITKTITPELRHPAAQTSEWGPLERRRARCGTRLGKEARPPYAGPRATAPWLTRACDMPGWRASRVPVRSPKERCPMLLTRGRRARRVAVIATVSRGRRDRNDRRRTGDELAQVRA